MSKKRKKKSISILKEVDKSLSGTYDNLQKEIEDMQNLLYMADMKARKKAKKMKKKKKDFNYEQIRKEAREEVLGNMEKTNFLDRISSVLQDIAPVVVIIARLVASLILAILSLDVVKLNIKPETLTKINSVYKRAMSVA